MTDTIPEDYADDYGVANGEAAEPAPEHDHHQSAIDHFRTHLAMTVADIASQPPVTDPVGIASVVMFTDQYLSPFLTDIEEDAEQDMIGHYEGKIMRLEALLDAAGAESAERLAEVWREGYDHAKAGRQRRVPKEYRA